VGGGKSGFPAGVAVAVSVGTWGGDAVSAGGVVAEGVGVPVSEQASEKNSKRGNSNFFIGTSRSERTQDYMPGGIMCNSLTTDEICTIRAHPCPIERETKTDIYGLAIRVYP